MEVIGMKMNKARELQSFSGLSNNHRNIVSRIIRFSSFMLRLDRRYAFVAIIYTMHLFNSKLTSITAASENRSLHQQNQQKYPDAKCEMNAETHTYHLQRWIKIEQEFSSYE
ncbi:hypothetical protein TNIN_377161 [Trichonephila inaurata madagascariensis]|uniref:Uncharacterized protein n=1 Tax=Trichonephila inaurata madagascariensis TaxID=2747483 RepID=A0A8X6Y6D8_9ARAC|nr:hypothetical protein TNIN_377161 [Trichonephila inaurata madagascariensis]